jgi:protein EFR3
VYAKDFWTSKRLIGLGALTSAVASEALYSAPSQFRMQVDIIVDSILATTHFSEMTELEEGCVPNRAYILSDANLTSHFSVTEMKDKSKTSELSEFRTRPVAERRAPSIYGHVDGEEGPKHKDVVLACLRAFSTLLGQSNAPQISAIMQATFDSLEHRTGWDKPVHCTWLAQQAIDWADYQYRYAVPTLLVEHLLEIQDAPTATPAQHALVDMITTVFTSPAPLVNLSTSDIISNLISLLLRRVSINPEDELLPDLVECIAALGTHVYYADQIQDLAGELIGRILVIEARGVPGRQGAADVGRAQALRCLLLALVGLIQTADKRIYTHDGLTRGDTVSSKGAPTKAKPLVHVTAASEATIMPYKPSRRAKIDSDVWQDTLTLLCDGSYPVRADYADALITYLGTEISKDDEATDADGVRRAHTLVSPTKQASSLSAALYGDGAKRFLNAIHGYLYVLATARSLGHNTSGTRPASRESPASSPEDTTNNSTAEEETVPGSQRESHIVASTLAPRVRKTSMTQRMLQSTAHGPAPAATASDYAHLLAVLTTVHEQLPMRGLLTGVPMLVTLSEAARVLEANPEDSRRARMLEEVIARVWLVIGKVWDCAEITNAANKVWGLGTSRITHV